MENNYKEQNKSTKLILGFTVKQFVAFVIGALIALLGLTFLVLGLLDDYGAFGANSPIKSPNIAMKALFGGLTFTWFGVIALAVGALIFSLSLSFASKGEDREKEKEARKEQRLKAMRERNNGIVLDFGDTTVKSKED